MEGNELKKETEFAEIKKRINAGWIGWRKVTGVLCDKNMPGSVKGRIYCTYVRPAMLYGMGTVPMTKAHEGRIEVAEMKMLKFSLGLTRVIRV